MLGSWPESSKATGCLLAGTGRLYLKQTPAFFGERRNLEGKFSFLHFLRYIRISKRAFK